MLGNVSGYLFNMIIRYAMYIGNKVVYISFYLLLLYKNSRMDYELFKSGPNCMYITKQKHVRLLDL